MSKERELLKEVLKVLEWNGIMGSHDTYNSIKELLAQPEQEPTRAPLSEDEIQDALIKHRRPTLWYCGFKAGVKYAEQKHGISGGGNETM